MISARWLVRSGCSWIRTTNEAGKPAGKRPRIRITASTPPADPTKATIGNPAGRVLDARVGFVLSTFT
jgi:hypothetical protein